MTLKNSFLMMLLLGALTFTGCDDDDDCMAPALEENIVGEWEVSFSNDIVEFKADGSFEDPQDAILGFPDVDDEMKTYSVTGDTLITATASTASGTISIDLSVTENECDRIGIEFGGLPGNLTRQ
jgi:hypothetical protein